MFKGRLLCPPPRAAYLGAIPNCEDLAPNCMPINPQSTALIQMKAAPCHSAPSRVCYDSGCIYLFALEIDFPTQVLQVMHAKIVHSPRPTVAHFSVLLLATVCCWYTLVKFACFQLLLRTFF